MPLRHWNATNGRLAMEITMLYAGLLGLWQLELSRRVIKLRRSEQIGMGDGGNIALQRRIRAHGNFTEYVPLVLIMIALLENAGAAPWLIHALGAALLIGRVLHGIALSFTQKWMPGRLVGMVLTFFVLAIAGVLCVVQSLGSLTGAQA